MDGVTDEAATTDTAGRKRFAYLEAPETYGVARDGGEDRLSDEVIGLARRGTVPRPRRTRRA